MMFMPSAFLLMANHFLSMPLVLLASGSLLLSSCGGGGNSTKSQVAPIEKYSIDEFVKNYYMEECIDVAINAKLKSEKDRENEISGLIDNPQVSVSEYQEFIFSEKYEKFLVRVEKQEEMMMFWDANTCFDGYRDKLMDRMAITCYVMPISKKLLALGVKPIYKYSSMFDIEFCLNAARETMDYFDSHDVIESNMTIAEVKKVLHEKLVENITNKAVSKYNKDNGIATEDSEENKENDFDWDLERIEYDKELGKFVVKETSSEDSEEKNLDKGE